MRFLPGNAQHIGDRSSQQDSFGFADLENRAFIEHGGFLAIVCDGMGGMENGGEASRTAVRAFLEAYASKTPEETIPEALERSAHAANDQVVALARTMSGVESMGTTLVATAIQGLSLFFISVGDSAIFHVSGGQIQLVNRPHVFANILDEAVARGAMSREDADAHPERESLTSFVGAESLHEIDRNTEPWPLSEGDTMLLASDGMFKTLEPPEISACLTGFPQGWPEGLVSRTIAKAREHQDNVTVLSVTVESELAATVPRTVLLSPSAPVDAKVPPASPVPPEAAPLVESKIEAAMSAPTEPARPVKSQTPSLIAAILILAAIIAAGWWYRSQQMHFRHAAKEASKPAAPAVDQAPQAAPAPPFQPEPKPDAASPLPREADPPPTLPLGVPNSPKPTAAPASVPGTPAPPPKETKTQK